MCPAPEAVLCVFCHRRPVDPAWRPFCSERCKLVDLGAWASERYRVPADEPKADEEGGNNPSG